MDKLTIILWVIIILGTFLQYFEGYYSQKKLSYILPILYTIAIIWLYFDGKSMTILPVLVALLIGNVWFFAYYESGKKRHEKIKAKNN